MELLVWNKKTSRAEINAKLAFMFHSQYGFPVEMFEELCNERFSQNKLLRVKAIISAYNVAHRTSYTI